MDNIHISDVRTFKSCRRKWNWASPLRQNLEPSIPYAPFFVGRAIHHCLEMHYTGEVGLWDAFDNYVENEQKITGAMWKGEQEKWDESISLIIGLLEHYMLWIQVDTSEFRDENLEFLQMEVPFQVPLFHPLTGSQSAYVQLEGRFDGIVRHIPTDTYWIWETKTTRSIGELSKSLENDEQASAYIYAAQILTGKKITGILYNMLRKKVPTSPKELQNGMLSKNKAIDTTVFQLVADIKRYHGEIANWEWITANYGDLLDNMPSIGQNGYFARLPIRRSDLEVKQMIDNIYWTAREMIDPDTQLYPAPNFVQCNFCAFRAPCLAMNRGGNYADLLEAEFQKRVVAESFREVEQ